MRRHFGLGQVTCHGLVYLALRYLIIGNLHSTVSVSLCRLDLGDWARARRHDRHGDKFFLVIVDLGHAQFPADEASHLSTHIWDYCVAG